MIGKTFLRLERDFDKHVAYCRDEPNAQEFLTGNDEVRQFFEVSCDLFLNFQKSCRRMDLFSAIEPAFKWGRRSFVCGFEKQKKSMKNQLPPIRDFSIENRKASRPDVDTGSWSLATVPKQLTNVRMFESKSKETSEKQAINSIWKAHGICRSARAVASTKFLSRNVHIESIEMQWNLSIGGLGQAAGNHRNQRSGKNKTIKRH